MKLEIIPAEQQNEQEQRQKIQQLWEQVKFKRDLYQQNLIKITKIQNQIQQKDICIEMTCQQSQINSQDQQNIIIKSLEQNDKNLDRFNKNESQITYNKKKIIRFKHKYIIKRILNNRDIFSKRFIEVIHKVDSNTESIVTIETVDASTQKLNKQISSLKNLKISKFTQLLFIKINLDDDQLFRDSDWLVSLEEIKNIKQIKKYDGYERRFIYELQRMISCKYCNCVFFSCKAFKKHKKQIHFLDKLRIM